MKIYSEAYDFLLLKALAQRPRINARTGVATRTIRGGVSMSVEVGDVLPVPTNRKVFPKSAAAEIAWYLQGTQNPSFIMAHAPKLWGKFIDPDNGLITNSYGYRWRRKFGRDQIAAAIVALKKDPSNRQVYVAAWDPMVDGLGNSALNVPCPVGFTFNIQGGELHSTLTLRSSDLFVGLPYDVMGHALLMDVMRQSIDRQLGLGVMHVTMADAHVYEEHVEMVTESLEVPPPATPPIVPLPMWDLGNLMIRPEAWVDSVATSAKLADWPKFNPKPEVVA